MRIFPLLYAAALSAASLGTARLEVVHTFSGQMPTGVTVSRSGRIFVNYPRWGDPVDFTVAEIRNGKEEPFPEADTNVPDMSKPGDHFLSVQSVVVDPRDRLWVLDTGSIQFGPTAYGGPKLIGIDLQGNRTFKKILFPQDVAPPATYLNDVRFDLTRGPEGMAFITDSGQGGPNGIIVVDLASGKSWRRLSNHASVKPDPVFIPTFDNKQVWNVAPSGKKERWAMGSDGIAIDPAKKLLYYCPLSSRHLFSVSLDAVADQSRSDADVAKTISDLGERPGASDGLESDREGRVYAGDYEHNAILRRDTAGKWQTLASDARILWPDTLSLTDGYLYFTCNQLARQKQFHAGKDLRQKPYYLFRIAIDGHRIAQ